MPGLKLTLFSLLLPLLGSSCALLSPAEKRGPDGKQKTVHLDIGHYVSGNRGTGAMSPRLPNNDRLEETRFWYKYAPYVRDELTRAGYGCVITNRGYAPTGSPFTDDKGYKSVVQLNRPDTHGRRGSIVRYPSAYHPECRSAGMISADYAIRQKAVCAVFLHHDSATTSWRTVYRSTILHNRNSGKALAGSIAASLNENVIGYGDKMPNGGRLCRTAPRSKDGTGGAGWLNTCDKEGMPAAIIEAAQLSTPEHVRWLYDENNAIRLARSVGQGIVRYLDSCDK